MRLELRESTAADASAMKALYEDAFPDEMAWPLIADLSQTPSAILSLVACGQATLAGHALFTFCTLAENGEKLALLGPIVVARAQQREGIGSALIRTGLQQLENAGVRRVCLLGDPGYYARFGFVCETHIAPPYRLPETWLAAWQSIGLGVPTASPHGKLSVPQPWLQPELWGAAQR